MRSRQTPTLLLKLLPEIEVPESFSVDGDFDLRVRALRDKFVEILAKQSKMSLDQITSLVVEMDFAPDKERVQERRRMMAAVSLYYGYDPIFRCTVSMRLASGCERTVIMRDPP